MVGPKVFYAHSSKEDGKEWQTLEEHLKNVAEIAGKFADKFKQKDWGYLAGLWHDLGKYSDEFQDYLRDSNVEIEPDDDEDAFSKKPRRTDHATAGARHAEKQLGKKGLLLSYCISGHHAGLPNGKHATETNLYKRIFDKKIPGINHSDKNILNPDINPNSPFLKRENESLDTSSVRVFIFIKMLYSCLVDADWLDTEKYCNPERYSERRRNQNNFTELITLFNNHMQKLNNNSCMRPINKVRKEIYDMCFKAGKSKKGFYSLTVPTGGGKTLSSMAFALEHLANNKMDRIIYAIPYTSIIEQNAKVFKNIFGKENVLEHHCNFDLEGDLKHLLSSQNWDFPIITTTNVQLFESIFSYRPSMSRKLHNIANSVIILDEAQILPVELLKPCLETMKSLVIDYGCSIVLCTATQPSLEKRKDFECGLEGVTEIVNGYQNVFDKLKRVEIKDIGKQSNEEITAKILKTQSALCIVNERKTAKEIYSLLKKNTGINVFHLSGLMCPVHRAETLEKIKMELRKDKKCFVVSTNLIEAGVDIDFPVVFRAYTGIDSIAQSAGRCNREGEPKIGKVFVFEPEKREPPFLRKRVESTRTVLRQHKEDMLSLPSIEAYFRELFWRRKDETDKKQIIEKIKQEIRELWIPFKEIGEEYRFIEDVSVPIIVPFGEKAEEIKKAMKEMRFSGPNSKTLSMVQPYTVTVYRNTLFNLLGHSVEEIANGVYLLINEEIYKKDIGLDYEDPFFRSIEANIF